MSQQYLLIRRIRVQSANAQATWWVINAAPVMACVMFGHALGRHLGTPAIGVAIVHHTAQLHGEQFKYFRPEQRRGAVFIDKTDYSSKNPHALSLQPTASFSGEFSLIVLFDATAELQLSRVDTFLERARLAGGQIIEHGKVEMYHSASELRRRIGAGYWLIDRRDLMQKSDGEDWLDVLLRITARRRRDESMEVSEPTAGDAVDREEDNDNPPPPVDTGKTALPPSWIMPTTLGYALLKPAIERAGAREGYPHAFAEPLVGPVQYVSLRDFGDRPLPLWRHGWPRDDVFLLSQPDMEI